jgi:hypothetical protein
MSLVGSLEDLGLADILQFVSLSRKSGLLVLRGDAGEGLIAFRAGLVVGARAAGGPRDLRDLLVAGGFADEATLDECAARAATRGASMEELLGEEVGLSPARLEALRREHVERAVFRLFAWCNGEFRFEMRDDPGVGAPDVALRKGLNAQYLTMEATRLCDEDLEYGPPPEAVGPEGNEPPLFSGELEAGSGPPIPPLPAPEEGSGWAGPGAALVAIDGVLARLEWLKCELGPLFERIHIFQSGESAIGRIRQYLSRGEIPVVLLSESAAGDDADRAFGSGGLLARLRAQAPSMPVALLGEEGRPAGDGPEVDAVLALPPAETFFGHHGAERLAEAAEDLRSAVEGFTRRRPVARTSASAPAPAPAPAEPSLRRLAEFSARVRDPGVEDDVLAGLLEYAAESFARVAVFTVCDGEVRGLAQIGLEKDGGPDDDALRALRIPASEAGWFQHALEDGRPRTAPPGNAGDRELAGRLGRSTPPAAFVGPIHSGGRVVAILYADGLPEGGPLPDATVLCIALDEVGLALERASLEQALARAGGAPDEPAGTPHLAP